MEALFLTIAILEVLNSMMGPTTPMCHFVLGAVHLFDLWVFRQTYTGFDLDHPVNAPLVAFPQSIGFLVGPQQGDHPNGFLELSILSKMLKASDHRDKIFAFLGLGLVPGPVPKYDQPPQKIYTHYALNYVTDACKLAERGINEKNHNFQLLGLLYTAGAMNHERPGLPSWVPDLSVHSYTKPFWYDPAHCTCADKKHLIYAAGGNSIAKVELLGNNRLRLPAKHFDIIQQAGIVEFILPAAGPNATARNLSKTLRPWLVESREIATENESLFSTYPTGEEMMDAYNRALTANRNSDGVDKSGKEIEQMRVNLAWLIKSPTMLDLLFTKNSFLSRRMSLTYLSKEVNILWMFRELTSAAHGRVFFRTAKGYYGLGPRGVKAGDGIFVTPGGWMPMILRQVEDGLEPKARLLGECYVHGIMKGEAMRDTSIPLDDVVLC
jgi:hypothetical protein